MGRRNGREENNWRIKRTSRIELELTLLLLNTRERERFHHSNGYKQTSCVFLSLLMHYYMYPTWRDGHGKKLTSIH